MYLYTPISGNLERRFEHLILSVQHRDPFRELLYLLFGSSLPLLRYMWYDVSVCNGFCNAGGDGFGMAARHYVRAGA